MSDFQKYLKYKNKYLQLKQQMNGGGILNNLKNKAVTAATNAANKAAETLQKQATDTLQKQGINDVNAVTEKLKINAQNISKEALQQTADSAIKAIQQTADTATKTIEQAINILNKN
jgi:hypothetical protein